MKYIAFLENLHSSEKAQNILPQWFIKSCFQNACNEQDGGFKFHRSGVSVSCTKCSLNILWLSLATLLHGLHLRLVPFLGKLPHESPQKI